MHHPDRRPTLVYLPGIHGDWTLIGRLREQLGDAVRWVEFTYPRTTEHTLQDTANGVRAELGKQGITQAWILAESFGSQVAWPLVTCNPTTPGSFQAEGLILAGGFGTYPSAVLLAFAQWVSRRLGPRAFGAPLRGYARLARRRVHGRPGLLADVDEFVERRTPQDWAAMQHRMRLISENHPETLAHGCRVPVHYLTGLLDPIVPWPPVPHWLRRHCPGFVDWRIVPAADHAVLVTAPAASARQILAWIRKPPPVAARPPNGVFHVPSKVTTERDPPAGATPSALHPHDSHTG